MSNFSNDHRNYLNLYTRFKTIPITTKDIEQFFLHKKLLVCGNISVAVPQFQVYNTLFAIFFSWCSLIIDPM